MLWSALKTQIRRTLEESSAAVWADESLLFWANRAVEDFGRKTKLLRDEQYASSVDGQRSYDLPDRTLEVIDFYYANKRLERMDTSPDGYFYNLNYQESSGTPRYYWIVSDEIILAPTPDSVQTMRFFRFYLPDEMDADSDTVPFTPYEEVLSFYVLSRAFDQIGDWQAAGEYMTRYDRDVDAAYAQALLEKNAAKASTSPREVW